MRRAYGLFAIAILSVTAMAAADDMDITFDGLTDGGWTLVNGADGSSASEFIPVENFNNSGLNGLNFNDLTGGVMYYSAPKSMLSIDLSAFKMNFNYQVNTAHDGRPFTEPLEGFDELYINGEAIAGLDIIDESITDRLQPVTIDFSGTAFSAIDLTDVRSLWVKAEWWGDDVNPSVESHLVAAGDPATVPEPRAIVLAIVALLGLIGLVRRR